MRRLKINIRGKVQGVGFRPFVYRLARQLELTGWVINSSNGVEIEIEGPDDRLQEFVTRLETEKPPHADIQSLKKNYLSLANYSSFEVRLSDETGDKTVSVLPDLATCPDCLQDIFDPHNRRYRYPFTNCTNCGPRYSIIESLPYDRAFTTMKNFIMCDDCQAEYQDPANRRFHAQPNACPQCGPHLELWDKNGKTLSAYDESLLQACDELKKGHILALKGLGGFQLLVDARNEDAVKLLRKRKHREEKPLALMYPSPEMISSDCIVSSEEKKLLLSVEAPIVLLRKKDNNLSTLSSVVAPDNPYLGIMLPYTPLHHLLMRELNFPIVATSGNLSEEPICIDENEALARLSQITDLFLIHNRPISRQMDDSVVRVMSGRSVVMRNARGFAPVTVDGFVSVQPCLAVGAHLKNTIAISKNSMILLSQHIGDLETRMAFEAHQAVTKSLAGIYDFEPEIVAGDLHPDYLSTKFAHQLNLPFIPVQHHYAHALACLVDNQLSPPALAVVWDGTGLGTDNTIWGGEFLNIDEKSYSRFMHFRTFCLPGGDKAIREPKRTAVGLLYEIFGEPVFSDPKHPVLKQFSSGEKEILLKMMTQHINSPVTSSAGRIFDAVASLIGLAHENHFEGQAAMKLEHAINNIVTNETYKFSIEAQTTPEIINWEPMIRDILSDVKNNISPGLISARFHNTMSEIIVKTAKKIGEKQILLTGGCFQNKYLTERTFERLKAGGFKPYFHKLIPPNDGGIAAGQIIAASRE